MQNAEKMAKPSPASAEEFVEISLKTVKYIPTKPNKRAGINDLEAFSFKNINERITAKTGCVLSRKMDRPTVVICRDVIQREQNKPGSLRSYKESAYMSHKYTIDKLEQFTLINLHEEKLDSTLAPQLKSDFVSLHTEGTRNVILDLT